MSRVLEYSLRVSAYTWLLLDDYPPFRLRPGGYPVRVELQPSRLRRLSVLFRCVLVIPAAFVAGLLAAGSCSSPSSTG